VNLLRSIRRWRQGIVSKFSSDW